MEKTYIYTLKDPTSNEIRYVGKTTNIKRRYYAHTNRNIAGKISNRHLGNWIMLLLNKNLKPELEIIDETNESWEWLEKYWISQFKTWGFSLLNISAGGKINENYSFKNNPELLLKAQKMALPILRDEKHREMARIRALGNKNMLGKKHSQDTKNKISKNRSGIKLSIESKIKQSNSLKKKIICLNTGIIFLGAEECAKYFKVNKYKIYNQLNGITKNKLNIKYYESRNM